MIAYLYPSVTNLCLQVKSEIEAAIEFLKEGRERDPYKDAVPRLLYEASWSGRQAPTFKV